MRANIFQLLPTSAVGKEFDYTKLDPATNAFKSFNVFDDKGERTSLLQDFFIPTIDRVPQLDHTQTDTFTENPFVHVGKDNTLLVAQYNPKYKGKGRTKLSLFVVDAQNKEDLEASLSYLKKVQGKEVSVPASIQEALLAAEKSKKLLKGENKTQGLRAKDIAIGGGGLGAAAVIATMIQQKRKQEQEEKQKKNAMLIRNFYAEGGALA
jgi:hypothetical protein